MENREIFLIVIIVILVILYTGKIFETYVNSGIPTNDDVTPKITVAMDYNGAILSDMPYYPNNLIIPPANVAPDIIKLQNYQPGYDGPNEVPSLQQYPSNSDIQEEFTMMNPFVPNP